MSKQWFSILGVFALLLAGCSTTPEQVDPYTLPAYADPDPNCRDVAGRYQASPHPMGEGLQDERPLLALTLLPNGQRLAQAVEVELLMGPEGSLQILAYDERGALVVKQLHRPESGFFQCDEGQLTFFPDKLGEPAGVEWNSVVVRKTTDGSLMLRKGGLFSGLIFLLAPMVVSTDDWYLFKPVP